MLKVNTLKLRLIGGGINERIIKGVSLKRRVCSENSPLTQGYKPLPTNRTSDPAIYATDPPQGEEKSEWNPTRRTEDEPDLLTPPKPSIASSPKLAHTGVGLPAKPILHHNRPFSTKPPPESITEVNCSGLDGSEWPDDTIDQKAQNKAQEEDNKEYFKHHKASPLSEIEFADSRKPITQATDTITKDEGLILFKEEQKDTAEEALLRANEIWKWNKIRGDPNSPHGRVLRELRGEFW